MALTPDAAQGLGVKELVASFDSRFPFNPSRTANLVAAATRVRHRSQSETQGSNL